MSLLWRSDAQCHGMGKWVHVGSQNNPWVALGVKDPWISFHRLQTLDEQACGDRCKALVSIGLERKISLLWCSDVQCHGMGKWVHVGSQNNPWVVWG